MAEETAIAESINAFGLELYASLQSQAGGSDNTIFSPVSISAALAMAYAGANGQTATQMASVLRFAGDSDAVSQEFGTLLSDLDSAGQGGNYTLSLADALWGQQGMQILTPFLQTMQADFSGDLQRVDFKDDPGAAVQTINSWVSQQTAGLIQNLL
ncbi:MAG TPA: serpin family protein, partial [Pirellulales bacterium]